MLYLVKRDIEPRDIIGEIFDIEHCQICLLVNVELQGFTPELGKQSFVCFIACDLAVGIA
jgi:hypothetical protein